ncbi:MAG: AAA family ATPase [Sulfurospirillum sp.]|nr:AAA family ATPase [Sulfurospirillum sp.]
MQILEKLEKLLEKRHVLLTGGAGVGKSYLTKELIAKQKSQGKQVVVLGSTGVSAVNIDGQTIHSFFVFGISDSLEELKRHDKFTKQRIKELQKLLESTDLLIIDEISMVSANLLDMILHRLRNSSFSGSILFVGDFFQLPPIVKTNAQNSLFNATRFAFQSSAWHYFDPLITQLSITKRTQDQKFFGILHKIRMGICDASVVEYLQNLQENHQVKEKNPTILYGTNKQAELKNLERLEALSEPKITLNAKEKIHLQSLSSARITSWKNALPIPSELVLKKGAIVLFCTNKWGSYYNGERGVIESIDEECIHVQKENAQIIKVERTEYTLSENMLLNGEIIDLPLCSLEQFPIKLAYAITIHKSQGMSIDPLLCNIDRIFETSQFYVAISRASNPQNLMLEYAGDKEAFTRQISRVIKVCKEVENFYENADMIDLESNLQATLF